ncbi:AMP-dependent synthetase/ligase [Robinsoniella peoriensis]
METKIQNMRDIIQYAADQYGEAPAIRYKVRKEVITKTYLDIQKDSEAFSRSLEKLDMLKKHVAVIGPTTYQWIISYFGTVNSGSVAVPLDAQLPAEEVCELLNRADISVLVFDELRKDLVQAVKEKCPGIQYLISMQALEHLDEMLSFSRLLEENAGSFSADIDCDKMTAILFTSGTTGKSKGVMLSHRNLADNAVCLDMKIPAGTISMTLLPIHHAYCFTMDILKAIYIGMVICINDSIMHVQKNMKLFKPEIVLLVPMVIESLYAKLVDATGILPKKMVAKAALGGNLKTICSGGAYLNPDLIDGFQAYGIRILQGYGMTECSPVISTNLEWDSRKNSVGKLLPGCEVKIVEEEIWVKSPSVMLGYYKMPKETAETLEDGWLKTGDLGYADEDHFLYITGRKKNLIILNNGENVSPEELENEISKAPLVKEIIVSEKDSLIQAEIFPDYEYAKKKRMKNIEAKLQNILDAYNKDRPVYKRIHGLKVREEEFVKTPSKKIKRV